MKILFLGDIVGKKGREVVRDFLSNLKETYQPDFIIANGENSAHGKGITLKIYKELIGYGIDCITMGNHTFSKHEIFENLDLMDNMVCPLNHIQQAGNFYRLFKVHDKTICVMNVLGRFCQEDYTLPIYERFDALYNSIKKENIDLIIVDYHGEATAEKRVFAQYYKNKINACLGTHTHIQTADEQIIDNCAFISDVGMCGPYNSIIGRDIDECIKRMVLNLKTHYTVSESEPILCAVLIEYDENNNCKNIQRIQIRPKNNAS